MASRPPPLHALYAILEFAPDPETLYALATTCRTLYSLFKVHETVLVQESLLRCMPQHILREAIRAERCKTPRVTVDFNCDMDFSLPDHTAVPEASDSDADFRKSRNVRVLKPELAEFLSRQWLKTYVKTILRAPDESLPRCTMAEGLRIIRFHKRTVMPLLWRFIDYCSREYLPLEDGEFAEVPLLESFKKQPPTLREKQRIQVALYRIEIYSKVLDSYCSHAGLSETGQRGAYWHLMYSNYSLWELAQIGAVHAFLSYMILCNIHEEHLSSHGLFGMDLPVSRACVGPQKLVNKGLSWVLKCMENCQTLRDTPISPDEECWDHGLYICLLSFDDVYVCKELDMKPMRGGLDEGSLREVWQSIQDANELGPDPRPDAHSVWGFPLWDKERAESLEGWTLPLVEETLPEQDDPTTYKASNYPLGIVDHFRLMGVAVED
ncbi:hypothetical protein LIA77_10289 [Sarocladium implicatum]|nr:hypothetical protein LIA77_10289 [Sarocladium implicatum]